GALPHPPYCSMMETPAGAEVNRLSFAEVMQLVQEGKEVPGVTKPDVQPSNQSPTPSRMQRVQKPWETASSFLTHSGTQVHTPLLKCPVSLWFTTGP
uniref:Peroxisomal membrane protein PEX14-like KPWE domain-containing protein n=1 Tax=Fundulus heteroclitus TaxID=8078 RepID=A0A3Q2NYA1_FUNHE